MSRFFSQYKRKVFLWMLLELLYALAMVYWAYFMKGIADTVLVGEGLRDFALLGLGFLAVDLAAEFGRLWARAWFLRAANYGLKDQVFERIVHYDIHAFHDRNSAGYISLLNNDLALIDEKYFRLAPAMGGQIILAVTAIVTIFLFHPLLALIDALLTALQMVPPMLFGDRASRAQKKYMASLDDMNVEIKDVFSGFEVIKSFGIEEKAEEKYLRIASEAENHGFSMRKEQARSMAVSAALSYLSSVLRLVFSVYLVLRGDISMGVLLGVMQISNYVSMPVQSICEGYLELKTAEPVLARVLSVLERKTEDGTGERRAVEAAAPIETEHLCFGYEEEKEILHDISFRFEKGKKYAVTGSSGSGKSTFLRLLMGYYDFYEGTIRYGDCSQSEADKKSLYRHMSMIHQKVILFEDTLRNNITMYEAYSDEEVWRAVEEAGLSGVAARMGKGLDSLVEEDGKNLSGGEQQRVAIARAFIRRTEVLLLDEGTSALDSRTAGQIDSLLLDKEGITLITVTHKMNPELLRRYDEILVMEQGRIWEHGPYESLSLQQQKRLEWCS